MTFNPEKHFLGKPCKHGHKSYRFKSTKACAECRYDRTAYQKEYNKSRLVKPNLIATRLIVGCRARQNKSNPNAPFDLTKDWLEQKINAGKCEVTGLPFNLGFTKTLKRPFAPSIDKKNPNGFYTQDNCQVVCFIYNVAKGEFTHDDVVTLANAVCK